MFNREFSLPLGSKNSFFIFGPRGTGKTHWLKTNIAPDSRIYIDLLDSSIYRTLTAKPENLQTFIPANFAGWIIIDEVQRASFVR